MRTGNIHIAGAKLVPPSLTMPEIASMTNIETGTIIHNSFSGVMQYWNGSSWQPYTIAVTAGVDSGVYVSNPSPGYFDIQNTQEPVVAGVGIQQAIIGGINVISTKLVAGDGIGITYPTGGTTNGSAVITNTQGPPVATCIYGQRTGPCSIAITSPTLTYMSYIGAIPSVSGSGRIDDTAEWNFDTFKFTATISRRWIFTASINDISAGEFWVPYLFHETTPFNQGRVMSGAPQIVGSRTNCSMTMICNMAVGDIVYPVMARSHIWGGPNPWCNMAFSGHTL